MELNKITFNLRLSEEINNKINVIAKTEQRSKNKEIEYILADYIKRYEINNGKIETEENN